MTGFFWNMRGFNKITKHQVVRDWIRSQSLQFGSLIETRVKENKAGDIMRSVFQNWSYMSNYEHHRLGRIWVVWGPSVRVTPVFKSSQLITCAVLQEGKEEEIFCTFVYALNTMEERRILWEDLRSHKDSSMFRNKKWLICGDFNETLDVGEHSRSENNPVVTAGMRDFQELVRYCSLTDMGAHGPVFTWCNKREDGLICKKLDRVLMNDVALHGLGRAYSVFESGGCSDHLRCRIQFDNEEIQKKRRPFKFTNVIATMKEFLPTVEGYWRETDKLFHSTSAMYRLGKKLKDLKPVMRSLSKDKLGHLHKKTKDSLESLCERQKETLSNPSTEAVRRECEALEKWQKLADIEEEVYKQKSKMHWLEVGDGNNRFFHNAAKIREVINAIREVLCPDGSIATKEEDIKREAERFFTELLTFKPNDYEMPKVEYLQEILGFRCSEVEQENLIKEVTAEEIKEVVFKMPSNKSPGPDGYTTEFFKAAWPILGNDVVVAVQSFFIKGFLPKGINSTILALIPKKKIAKEMKDYRPISCCNVLYKIISKLLANRLKGIMPKFISSNQSAFVKDRLLMENLLLATELVKDYHKSEISPRCAMKIDISKAFDSVQWPFLLATLEALGFPAKYIHWIRLCISTASFSVQVNGELAGYFNSARGLRQGCALSPSLFVICMNVLSKLLDKAAVDRLVGYHPRCKNALLTHLCFADDIMVFTDGQKRSVEGILQVFNDFEKLSGLKISLEKSTLYMAGISVENQSAILENFPFEAGQLPVRYLGLPLLTRKMTVSDYLPLMEKIKTRMCNWNGRFLSYAGRLQLLKSVIMSLANFWFSAFRLPRQCINGIEKLCAAFLWSGPELNTRKSKVSWKEVCKKKEEGGLGLRDLKEVNEVSCLKLIWRILSGQNSLWVQWIQKNLIRKGSFWSVKENSTIGSWMWKKILKTRDAAKEFHRVEVKNGESTSFWYDHWCTMGRLKDLLGERSYIDMGIPETWTVAEVIQKHRRRRHRVVILNLVEEEIEKLKSRRLKCMDVAVWKNREERYKPNFSSKSTWLLVRKEHILQRWSKCVWFKHATPKYSFHAWTAMLDRLSTCDRMLKWNQAIDPICVLCKQEGETRNHLFFSCAYSSYIWQKLIGGLLGTRYTERWEDIIEIMLDLRQDRVKLFLIRYAFQAAIHSIWRERNYRRHGDKQIPHMLLAKVIDKNVRNRLSTIQRQGDKKMEKGLQVWFGTR